MLKFRQYLLGRTFSIITDHKPLIHLFSPSRAIPHLASTRIQRWALTLSGYDYTISHKSGRDNLDADALSQLPLPNVPSDVPLPGECVLLLQTLKQSATVTAKQIQTWTNTDSVLSKVCQFVLHGWPARVEEEELKPFFRRRLELSTLHDCLLWGNQVIVPLPGRESVLHDLHKTHPGV